MAKTTIYPTFRSGDKKKTKPRFMRDAAGFFNYTCSRCSAPALYRKRQIHREHALCTDCRG